MTYFYFAEECGQNWTKLKIGPKLDRKKLWKKWSKIVEKNNFCPQKFVN